MSKDDAKQVVLQVGAVLRKLRKEKQLSLEELAEATGVSKLTLGNIERGETNPTLGMMWKIANGLSVPLMALFLTDNQVNLSRAGEGLQIVGDQRTWTIEPIFQNAGFGTSELYRAYLQPHSTYQPEPHQHGSIEIVTLMAGSVTVTVGEMPYPLRPFDSIRFPANDVHAYTNDSDEPAVLHILLRYGDTRM